MNEEKKKEFEEKFVDENYRKNGRTPHGYTEWLAEPEIVWQWIESLLKEQREQYYYHIENSSGTKEADYIDKMVNTPPTGAKK